MLEKVLFNLLKIVCFLDTGACSNASFTCSDRSCIPISFYCDNVTHCPGGADERNCGMNFNNFDTFCYKYLGLHDCDSAKL